jgi:predicted DNA-binding protein (UPF0251 family)
LTSGPIKKRVLRGHDFQVRIRVPQRSLKPALSPVAVAGPAPDPDRAERLAIRDEEIGRLPERQRAAVVLCDLEGLPHEEAARRLGCPVGTVESRLSRGRLRLRDRLVRRGLAPAAAALWPQMAREASAALPASLLKHSGRLVMSSRAAGAVPAAVTALAEGVIQMMSAITIG